MVSLNEPAPPEGYTVNFKVEPVENSGGHSHHDDSRRKGTVTPTTLTIPPGSLEPVYALYSSSDVSGQEKIIVEVSGEKKSETTVSVKVPGLMRLDDGENYDLKESTSIHPSSYWGAMDALAYFNSIVNAYAVTFPNNERLVVTDISLPWGGVFDLCGTYKPQDKCSAASNGGHSSHRTGRDVDVRKWNIPEENREQFKKICFDYGRARARDHGNHYHLDF